MQVITYQTSRGAKLSICAECEQRLRNNWPRDSRGEEYAAVSHGLHEGRCDVHKGPVMSKRLPDPGKCDCGHRGDWDRPMYGKVGDQPHYWPTCPRHRDHTTGNPVPARDYREASRDA